MICTVLQFSAEIFANSEQYFCGEQQHNCVSGSGGYSLLCHEQLASKSSALEHQEQESFCREVSKPL